MINRDNISQGDTLWVEVKVDVYDKSILINQDVIRNSDGIDNREIKVLRHIPKPVDEPTGLGAVVEVFLNDAPVKKYTFVKTSTVNPNCWKANVVGDISYSWKDIINSYRVIKVVGEGVEVDKH